MTWDKVFRSKFADDNLRPNLRLELQVDRPPAKLPIDDVRERKLLHFVVGALILAMVFIGFVWSRQ